MEWIIQISGDNLDLQELSKSLNSPELCISQENNNFFLSQRTSTS